MWCSMQCILRTRCGGFYLKDAVTLEELKDGKFKLISADCVFNYEKLELNDDEFFRIENGQTLRKEVLDGKYKLYNSSTFLGIGECYNNNLKLTLRLF